MKETEGLVSHSITSKWNEDLAQELKPMIEQGFNNGLEFVELRIKKDKYITYFGGMITHLQNIIAPLCGRLGLEASIKDDTIFGGDVIMKLKRDFDNPKYKNNAGGTGIIYIGG